MGVQFKILTLDTEQNFEPQEKHSKHDHKNNSLKSSGNIPSHENLKYLPTPSHIFAENLTLGVHLKMGLQLNISALR